MYDDPAFMNLVEVIRNADIAFFQRQGGERMGVCFLLSARR